MAVQMDFSWSQYDDGVLQINITPPTSMSGQNVEFRVGRYFGGEMDTIVKSCASGFNGVSGIALANGGATLNVTIASVDTSGMQYGNWSYQARRTTSGFVTETTLGLMLLNP